MDGPQFLWLIPLGLLVYGAFKALSNSTDNNPPKGDAVTDTTRKREEEKSKPGAEE